MKKTATPSGGQVMRAVLPALIALAVLAPWAPASGAEAASGATSETSAYRVTNLGTLGGSFCAGFVGQNSFATAVNDLRQVAGGSCKSDSLFRTEIHPFFFSGGVMTDLGVPGSAFGMNDAGQVVGSTGTPDVEFSGSAFLWSEGTLVDLSPVLGGFSRAHDIDNTGQVVGFRGAARLDSWQAFLYDTIGGSVTDLGTLGGTFRSAGTAINDQGHIAGYASITGDTAIHAFLWRSGVMTDLGTLGGPYSFANGLNSSDQVVGRSFTPSGERGFLWSEGVMRDLGTLGGGSSTAWGINDSGQIVGSALTGSAVQHAFMHKDGLMQDLNDLIPADSGWTLIVARSINDSGHIVGTGRFGGEARAFLLTPADAPDTTPPILTIPTDSTLDATGPSGTTFDYLVTATDDIDPNPTVSCVPESGSTFPIGTTTVTCTATDASGNIASASFVVHVRGAEELLDDLLVRFLFFPLGPGSSLASQIGAARLLLVSGDLSAACNLIGAFVREVEAQAGRTLLSEEAADLIDAANRIRAVLAC